MFQKEGFLSLWASPINSPVAIQRWSSCCGSGRSSGKPSGRRWRVEAPELPIIELRREPNLAAEVSGLKTVAIVKSHVNWELIGPEPLRKETAGV
jgi:hypothetical protein